MVTNTQGKGRQKQRVCNVEHPQRAGGTISFAFTLKTPQFYLTRFVSSPSSPALCPRSPQLCDVSPLYQT